MTLACLFGADLAAQFQPFSTHDWTVNVLLNPFAETWVDVKMPGGNPRLDQSSAPLLADERRTYVVGTIEVVDTDPANGVLFSERAASPDIIAPFTLTEGRRQVVMLQCNRHERGTDVTLADDPNGAIWQRYFYGLTGTTQNPVVERANNARAVSVWEAEEAADTRIAICGETFDERLEASQAASGWSAHSSDHATGFIAVYDGSGQLLWTHHFFAGTNGALDCAVTDLSIRVDDEGNEIVTYCGISSHGDPGVGTELSPLRAFASPATGVLSSGSTVQAAGQWDGFVGRLVRPVGVTSASRVFHSIVGGPGQDGLFGLAEIDENRFAVVGSSDAAIGQEGFPVHFQGAAVLVAPYRIGVVLVFDASLIAASGNLVLDSASGLGAVGAEVATIARDVCVGFGVNFDDATTSVEDLLYVVGSTDDPAFDAIPLEFQPAITTFGGITDGFLATFRDQPGPLGLSILQAQVFAYWGHDDPTAEPPIESIDGLTGVNNWNEFSEHVSVAGFTNHTDYDVGVTSYFFNTAYGPFVGSPPNNDMDLIRVRDDVIGGNTDDRPAFHGRLNANGPSPGTGLAFETHGLGHIGAGGVAVGNDGRVNVVGRTSPADGTYPVTAMHPVARMADLGQDAVRTEVDLVPSSAPGLPGVARTDGTGFQGNGVNFPVPDYWGTTTPRCALSPYGRRIGEPLPAIGGMLIDYEGSPPAPGVNDAAITVTRPTPYMGSQTFGVLWFGFPPTTGAPTINGVEFWSNPTTWTAIPTAWPGVRPYRLNLAPMPSGSSATVSAQLYCLLDVANTVGTLGPLGFGLVPLASGCSSEFTASPALWFSY